MAELVFRCPPLGSLGFLFCFTLSNMSQSKSKLKNLLLVWFVCFNPQAVLVYTVMYLLKTYIALICN